MNLMQFVGMTVEDASSYANKGGLEVRIQNVGLQPLNNDYNPGRINFKIKDGVVLNATIG